MSSAPAGSAQRVYNSAAPQAVAGKNAPPARAGAPYSPPRPRRHSAAPHPGPAPPLSPAPFAAAAAADSWLRLRGQQPRPPRPSSCGAPIPASLGRLPPAPRGATPARHPQPWPAPPQPPPPPHRPTEHARAAAVPARARTSLAGLPAALAPPRAPLGPIPGLPAAAARPAGLAGRGRGRGRTVAWSPRAAYRSRTLLPGRLAPLRGSPRTVGSGISNRPPSERTATCPGFRRPLPRHHSVPRFSCWPSFRFWNFKQSHDWAQPFAFPPFSTLSPPFSVTPVLEMEC